MNQSIPQIIFSHTRKFPQFTQRIYFKPKSMSIDSVLWAQTHILQFSKFNSFQHDFQKSPAIIGAVSIWNCPLKISLLIFSIDYFCLTSAVRGQGFYVAAGYLSKLLLVGAVCDFHFWSPSVWNAVLVTVDLTRGFGAGPGLMIFVFMTHIASYSLGTGSFVASPCVLDIWSSHRGAQAIINSRTFLRTWTSSVFWLTRRMPSHSWTSYSRRIFDLEMLSKGMICVNHILVAPAEAEGGQSRIA